MVYGCIRTTGVLVVIFLTLSSCGLKRKASDTANPDDANFNLAKGSESSAYPQVVALRNQATNTVCTGTFVGHTTVLSASHCITTNNPSDYLVFTGTQLAAYKAGQLNLDQVIKVKSILGTPISVINGATCSVDLALFQTYTPSPSGFLKIATVKPAYNSAVIGVGYGYTELQILDGKARAGTFTIANPIPLPLEPSFKTYEAGLVFTLSSSQTTYNLAGDSGGPKLLNNEIVGVTSGAGVYQPTDSQMSINVAMASNVSKNFIANAVARGYDIGQVQVQPNPTPTPVVVPPPPTPTPVVCVPVASLHNNSLSADVNGTGTVEPLDVLIVVNAIGRLKKTGRPLPIQLKQEDSSYYIDVSGDGCLTDADAALVTQHLNKRTQ